MTNNVQMLDNIPAHIFDDPNRASFLTLSLSSSARQLTLDRFVPVPPQPGGLYTHRTSSRSRQVRSHQTGLDAGLLQTVLQPIHILCDAGEVRLQCLDARSQRQPSRSTRVRGRAGV